MSSDIHFSLLLVLVFQKKKCWEIKKKIQYVSGNRLHVCIFFLIYLAGFWLLNYPVLFSISLLVAHLFEFRDSDGGENIQVWCSGLQCCDTGRSCPPQQCPGASVASIHEPSSLACPTHVIELLLPQCISVGPYPRDASLLSGDADSNSSSITAGKPVRLSYHRVAFRHTQLTECFTISHVFLLFREIAKVYFVVINPLGFSE